MITVSQDLPLNFDIVTAPTPLHVCAGIAPGSAAIVFEMPSGKHGLLRFNIRELETALAVVANYGWKVIVDLPAPIAEMAAVVEPPAQPEVTLSASTAEMLNKPGEECPAPVVVGDFLEPSPVATKEELPKPAKSFWRQG
jgi:hypothetical protein